MFDNIKLRTARNSSRNKQPVPIQQQGWRGVNYVDNIYQIQPHQLPYSESADLGTPIGSISKTMGRESLFSSLGSGRMICKTWEHSDGNKIIAEWGKKLYLLSGEAGNVSKSSQADWEAGSGNNIDTTSSPGDMQLAKSGDNFSATATNTADFNGSHSQTVAANNSVKLTINPTGGGVARYYIQNSSASYNPTAKGAWDVTSSDCDPFKLSKTKSGSITSAGGDSSDNGANTDMLLIKAVSDPLPTTKTISGTLSWCLGVRENSSSYNMVYHIHVWVTQGDSSTVRGTLLSNYLGSTEWPSTAAGLSVSAQALSSVNAQAGDRIVIEIGCKSGASSSYYGNVWYGGTGSDLTNGGDETTLTGWFQFSNDFADQYYSEGTYTHSEQDISSIGTTTGLSISYNKTTPSGTTVTVETRTSTDGGDTYGSWTERTSGDTIVALGTDVSNYRIQWRATLETTDVSITPSLDDVTVSGNTGYNITGEWVSPVYDLVNTPLTAVLSFVQTKPSGTSITWYEAGSSNGTVFGDWQTIATSGDGIPLLRYAKVKIVFSGMVTTTPKVSSLLINHTSSFTEANLLDISPLGRTDDELTGNRVSMQEYSDRLYCADGLRPFVLYVDEDTEIVGTAQSGGSSFITLASGSSVNDFYNNGFITLTSGQGAGQTRFIEDYNGATKRVTPSVPFDPAPSSNTGYSIGSAVKARNAGVDPPASACSAVSGSSTGLTGTFRYKYTYVNRDGYESNPSTVSSSVTVSNQKISVSNIAVGDSTIVARKIYRTKTGGSVYYYVATIEDNTTTTYTDTTSDSSLVTLMLDTNNIPPNCSLVYPFLTYMFYAFFDELWFSNATEPESVPANVGDIQVIICPGNILDIKSNPMALIPMGDNFIAPITTSSGFIFDSDPTVDTTTMRVIDRNGCFSSWASDMCISPDLRSILVFPTNTGVRTLLPGLQEESIESIPLSKNIQSYLDRSINRTNMAGIFFENRYIMVPPIVKTNF